MVQALRSTKCNFITIIANIRRRILISINWTANGLYFVLL